MVGIEIEIGRLDFDALWRDVEDHAVRFLERHQPEVDRQLHSERNIPRRTGRLQHSLHTEVARGRGDVIAEMRNTSDVLYSQWVPALEPAVRQLYEHRVIPKLQADWRRERIPTPRTNRRR